MAMFRRISSLLRRYSDSLAETSVKVTKRVQFGRAEKSRSWGETKNGKKTESTEKGERKSSDSFDQEDDGTGFSRTQQYFFAFTYTAAAGVLRSIFNPNVRKSTEIQIEKESTGHLEVKVNMNEPGGAETKLEIKDDGKVTSLQFSHNTCTKQISS